MSDIVLSSSVRQNLLSLQSTADLLATTQTRLATGKKVNTALDNPTNFFTASSLDARASDINNLLDGIGNGVQVLQAANTGITSLQKLVDTAKSIANQALQTPVGYTKSAATSGANAGVSASNLLGTTAAVTSSVAGSTLTNNATATYAVTAGTPGSAQNNNHIGAYQSVAVAGSAQTNNHLGAYQSVAVPGSIVLNDNTTTAVGITGATKLAGVAGGASDNLSTAFTALDTLSVNGTTITFNSGSGTTGSATAGTLSIDITTGDVQDVVDAIDAISGGAAATFNAGAITLNTGTTADLDITGTALAKLGLSAAVTPRTNAAPTPAFISGATKLSGTATPTSDAVSTAFTTADTIVVNGTTINFTAAGTGLQDATHVRIDDDINTLLGKIDAISGGTGSAVNATTGVITLNTGTTSDLDISGSGLTKLGLSAAITPRTNAAPTPAPITASTQIAGAATPTSNALSTAFTTADTIVVNGQTLSFHSGGGNTGTAGAGNLSIDITTGTVQQVLTAINAYSGGTSAIDPTTGAITLSTGTTADLNVNGTGLAKLGLSAGITPRTSTPVTGAPIDNTTTLTGGVGTNSLTTAFNTGDTIVVNGKTISFNSGAGNTGTAAAGNLSLDITTATVADVLGAIDAYSGGSGSAVVNGRATLVASTAANLVISGSGLAKIGLVAGTTPASTAATTGLSGLTLTIGSTGGGTPTNITFGLGATQVSTLDQLNAALSANNLQASVSTTGQIMLTTTNDAASSNIAVIGGTATDPGNAFAGVSVVGASADATSQATRAGLVSQYNNIIDQIRTTSQDASFNGVNLLAGDQLKLVFNETGKSTLNIAGTALDPAGLGLGTLIKGTDFIDNASTNKILAALNSAGSFLRSQASTLGSNLSIVQIRQDFSKNLINVLQTGSANLTVADTNEEAANSQALATRQSIAVSALALANQSQQSVLKLLQ
jgi:flagellin-like hook-associated protein FlgL